MQSDPALVIRQQAETIRQQAQALRRQRETIRQQAQVIRRQEEIIRRQQARIAALETQVAHLTAQLAQRDAAIVRLQEQVAALAAQVARLSKNSSTSSKPPSSDITKPPQPPAPAGGRRIGGQPRSGRPSSYLGANRETRCQPGLPGMGNGPKRPHRPGGRPVPAARLISYAAAPIGAVTPVGRAAGRNHGHGGHQGNGRACACRAVLRVSAFGFPSELGPRNSALAAGLRAGTPLTRPVMAVPR